MNKSTTAQGITLNFPRDALGAHIADASVLLSKSELCEESNNAKA